MTDESETAVPHRRLLQKTSDALFVVDSEDRFDTVNNAFLDLVGYDRTRLQGTKVMALLADDAVAEWQHHVSLLRTDEEADSWVTRVVTKTGTEVPIELDCEVAAPDGSIAGVARDVRRRERKEQKLDVLNRALRHNIRNRMNIILGKAATLQAVEDEGYRTAAERIEEVGKEIINISDKARKAQKYLGIPPDEECKVDLASMTEEVIMKFKISYPDATVATDLPDRAPARAPPSAEVAVMELLENGVVHHPSGDGTVSVTVASEDGRVRVRVRDECPSIPETVVESLEAGAEQPLKHNDGIGLWLVQWVVETVGGDLEFTRRSDGKGNEVTLVFDTIEE